MAAAPAQPGGNYVSPELCLGDWQLQDDSDCGNKDGQYQENIAAEQIEISGAPVNIFKLLGTHEQGKLIDLTGEGYPLSSGSQAGYDAARAFDDSPISWLTQVTGNQVVQKAYLGYCFGTKKTSWGAEKYDNHAPIVHKINAIRIKQGSLQQNRVLQVRVEASSNGVKWDRVAIINLPNSNNLELIRWSNGYAANYWRLVPTFFAGGANDHWEVVELELLDATATLLDGIQDPFFLENRDRHYSKTSIQLKSSYQPFDSMGDLSKFGFNVADQYAFTVSFARMIQLLGRPIVVGDILELPPEMQYDQNLAKVLKYLEVTDTNWAADGFTTGWRPILFRFQAQQLIPSAETRDIIGPPETSAIPMTDADFFGDLAPVMTQQHDASIEIQVEALDEVPARGMDAREIKSAESSHVKHGYDGRDYGVEDAFPPNNLPYGEGFELPPIPGPADGDYYRLIYPEHTKIPTRLYKFSIYKNRWIFIEQDRRDEYSSFKPSIRNAMRSANKKSIKSDI